MWELEHKEGWGPKNWCFWTVVLEKTLESPLDCKEIQPVHPKGNQSWVFIGRTDAEAEAPIFWPPDAKSWLIGKDPDAGKDWRQEEKGTIEDEVVGWHHRLKEHEFEQAPGDGEGQGSLVCCSPWDHKESDTTEWLNNNKYIFVRTGSVYLLIPFICSTQSPPPPTTPALPGDHQFALCVHESLPVLFVLLCFIFHVNVRSYSNCLSLSDFFYLA